jgi:hypothetical protein
MGVDATHGRFGEVSLETCLLCGRIWLHYHLEYEAFPNSGRWFRGLISQEQIAAMTPQDAIPYLERLPWYFIGGSYYRSRGQRSSGKIDAAL